MKIFAWVVLGLVFIGGVGGVMDDYINDDRTYRIIISLVTAAYIGFVLIVR